MRGIWVRFILLLSVLMVAACDRAPKSTTSTKITLNFSSSAMGKMESVSAMTGEIRCYAVSIRGEGIANNPLNSCSRATGIKSGFVQAGGGGNSSISLVVPQGPARIVDVYLLKTTGSCPTSFNHDFYAYHPNLYLAGTSSPTDMFVDAVAVNVSVSNDDDPLINSITGVCNAPTPTPTPAASNSQFRIRSAGGYATGGDFKLYGSVGRPNSGEVLVGPGGTPAYKLYVK